MRYFDAYRMEKWLFTRCGECGAVVAEVDQETHTEWHESAARKTEQLRQMYTYLLAHAEHETRGDPESMPPLVEARRALRQQYPPPSWPVENQCGPECSERHTYADGCALFMAHPCNPIDTL